MKIKTLRQWLKQQVNLNFLIGSVGIFCDFFQQKHEINRDHKIGFLLYM